MVGIFSRFSRSAHRRAQSAIDLREALPSAPETTTAAIASAAASLSGVPHGIEIATEFKPVERPSEPLDNDQPVQCPLPEPSILNDGRIWKERVSSVVPRRSDALAPPIQKETSTEPDTLLRKPPPAPKRVILPSISAPEHNILKLLDECNASGIQSCDN